MEVQLSYLTLRRVVKALKILGLYPIDIGSPKIQQLWHKLFRRLMLSFVITYATQEIIQIYQVRNDADTLIAVTYIFLTYSAYIYKVIIINIRSTEIKQLLDIIKGPVYNQGEPEHRETFLKAYKRSLIVGPLFNYMAALTALLMNLSPTVSHIQGNKVVFAIWLPFDSNANSRFYSVIVYTSFSNICLAFGNTMLDLLIVMLLEQCTTQLSILRINLESLVEKSKNEQDKTRNTFDDIFERRLKKIFSHHNLIIRMAAKIDDIFGYIVLYQFVLGGWILCTAAYNLTKANINFVEMMSLSCYLFAIIMEYLFYCYYGNDLTLESQMLNDSVYMMEWLSLAMKHRLMLLIFMERCKRPINPMAGKIIPLSNKTFISILRSSFSLYAFLKNTSTNDA